METSGAGARMQDRTVIISRGGSYLISGTLTDGQIYVDAGKDERVELILNGVTISNEDDAAVYIEEAGHTVIILAENTRNSLQSGTAPGGREGKAGDENAGGAVLYAKDDLSITGTGSLQISAYIRNGIHTKKHLLIEGGSIAIEAVNHAIKGKDSVGITGGDLTLTAGNKGIESDFEIQITDGSVRITDSAEGIEANQIIIEGGIIDITASDDGMNANGGAAKKKKNPEEDIVEKMPNLIIRGGEISVNAQGDGLDSNGNLLIEGGYIIIDGPERDDDGPLDFGVENGGVCTVSGGTVLAIGSAGMAVGFDENSKQCSFCYIFDDAYPEDSEILISDADGNALCRHIAVKKGASVVFSAPVLTPGETYLLSVDGQAIAIPIPPDSD